MDGPQNWSTRLKWLSGLLSGIVFVIREGKWTISQTNRRILFTRNRGEIKLNFIVNYSQKFELV